MIAVDQSKNKDAAVRALGAQTGRPLDHSVIDGNVPLSAAAKDRLILLENLFKGDLPDNLPDIEVLAKMRFKDCTDFIAAKEEQVRESA